MPVRKIPKSYRARTGVFYSFKNKCGVGFESALEEDFCLRQEFKKFVIGYEGQPLWVDFKSNGRNKHYPPDYLVKYAQLSGILPLLAEIKYLSELKKKEAEFKDKFDAAKKYAKESGMEFKVFTENDIRLPDLENLKFLYKFALMPTMFFEYKEKIVSNILMEQKMTIGQLLNRLSTDRYEQAKAVPTLLHLMYLGVVVSDLNKKLNKKSIIEVADGNIGT